MSTATKPPPPIRIRRITACGKKRHYSEDAANLHMRELERWESHNGVWKLGILNVYFCKQCSAWHVGHTLKEDLDQKDNAIMSSETETQAVARAKETARIAQFERQQTRLERRRRMNHEEATTERSVVSPKVFSERGV